MKLDYISFFMDQTLKFLVDKITQLTNRLNLMVQNSKKIHELATASSTQNVYIAVSDGVSTGKAIYMPSEVSLATFNNIANMRLGADPTSSQIFIKDAGDNILSTLDVSFLNGNSVTLNVDSATNSLQLLNYKGEIISSILLSSFYPVQRQQGLFEHILTAGDIANPIMTFQLPHTPIMDEWEFLYVGAGIVSPVSYSVTGDILTINTATFTYPVQAGRRLLYRYMY